MVVMVTGIITVGAVFILRPITKQLGAYLRTMSQQKQEAGPSPEVLQLRDTLSSIESRLALLEERQNFTENLLSAPREPRAIQPGPGKVPRGIEV